MGLSSCNLPYGSFGAFSIIQSARPPSRMQDKRQSDCILGFTDRPLPWSILAPPVP
jgi:hypothetical protein